MKPFKHLKYHGIVNFLSKKETRLSLAIQLVLAPFLSHGYDFRVSYVAARNIVYGNSPYIGGVVEGQLAEGYGSYVQGIGETPLWPLYLGLAYIISGGGIILFNTLLKIPIIIANIGLAYLFYRNGNDAWKFFLLNPFILLTTSIWGKPDNIATLLLVYSLTILPQVKRSSTILSISANIKPLIAALTPVLIAIVRGEKNRFLLYLTVISTAFFILPFIVLGWPLETVINGFPNWFKPAGGISPFNIIELLYGSQFLPEDLSPVGYAPAILALLLAVLFLAKPPMGEKDILFYSLLSASLFFSIRPWVSEQNLILVLALFALHSGRPPPRIIWIIPLIFAFFNNSIQQQLYLIRPQVVDELEALDSTIKTYRLSAKFILALGWLSALWYHIAKISKWKA